MSTHFTKEHALTFTVAFLRVAAIATALACVPRVYSEDGNTKQLCFVVQEHTQLCKSPTAQFTSLSLTSPNPRPNASQIFDGNRSIRAFSICNDLFADYMVCVSSEVRFFLRPFLQEPFCTLGSFTLQSLSNRPVYIPDLIQVLATKIVTIRVVSYLNDTHVDTQDIDNFRFFFFWDFDSDVQVENTFAKNQISLSVGKLKQFTLFVPTCKWHLKSSTNRPNADFVRIDAERIDSGIKSNTTKRSKLSLDFLIELVSVSDLCKQQTNHLRRQKEVLSDVEIDELMQLEPLEHFCTPSNFGYPISGSVSHSKSVFQQLRLFFVRNQFDLDGNAHKVMVFKSLKKVNTISFFAASCGGAPIEVLKKYVQDQGKAALKGGVSTQGEPG